MNGSFEVKLEGLYQNKSRFHKAPLLNQVYSHSNQLDWVQNMINSAAEQASKWMQILGERTIKIFPVLDVTSLYDPRPNSMSTFSLQLCALQQIRFRLTYYDYSADQNCLNKRSTTNDGGV